MKKQIAFLISTLKDGGAERAVSNISNNLNKEKFEIYIILFDGENISYSYSGKIIDLKLPANSNFFVKLSNNLKRYYRLKLVKKEFDFDAVISFLPTPNILNILTKTKKQMTIISIRNYVSLEQTDIYGKFNNFFRKTIYKKADSIVAVSETIKQNLIESFKIKQSLIKVIYNGYPINNIIQDSKEVIDQSYNSIFMNPTVITSGRLAYQKGHWLLIEAISLARKVIPDIQLVILGNGEYIKKLRKQVIVNNLFEQVHFLGYVANPFKYIYNSDLFVLSSLYEGFPNVLAEAMACEVPVISTDCLSGPREILTPRLVNQKINDYRNVGEYGILIDRPLQTENISDNQVLIENLSEKIVKLLLDDSVKQHYKKQSERRVKDFDINTIINKWEDLLLKGDV